jgi:hypothetical protein
MLIIDFIKNCISYLNDYYNLVTAVATVVMAVATVFMVCVTGKIKNLNKKLTNIEGQKQKDDLFKIRWECYHEILERLQKHHLLYVDELLNCVHNRLRLGDGMPASQSLKDFTVNHFFTSKVRWLFDDEIADIVEKLLTFQNHFPNQNLWKEEEKYYYDCLEVKEWKVYTKGSQGYETEKIVSIKPNFIKKFDKYLNLNEV